MVKFANKPAVVEADLPKPDEFTTFHPFIKGVFSQWHFTPFDSGGLRFVCAQQCMMAAKASLCDDAEIFDQIMQSEDPAMHKRLGSQVESFDHEAWNDWRFDIVMTANVAKFEQNKGAARQLLNTAPALLVEANPRDWNWGNGLQLDDPGNHDPSQWRGTNFLGRILTFVRSQIAGI